MGGQTVPVYNVCRSTGRSSIPALRQKVPSIRNRRYNSGPVQVPLWGGGSGA